MTDNDALLQAILDDPDEDAPRLGYADWLEEHGEPARAQFIRLQLARAALEDHDPRAQELQQRCREMTAEPGTAQRWTPKLPRGMGYPEFHRGFVEKVSCRITDFLKGAERLVAVIPLRHLNVGETSPTRQDLQALLASPHLAWLRELALYGNHLDDSATEAIAASPHLRGLEELDLWDNRIGPAGVRALVGSPNLAGLRGLSLACNPLGDEGARVLAASPRPGRFKFLSLGDCGIGVEGAAALAASPHLVGLRTLDLGSSAGGP